MIPLIPNNQFTKASPLAKGAILIASNQLGRGEACDHVGLDGKSLAHNNCGPWIRTYRLDDKRGAWCACLVCWCYHLQWVRLHGWQTILQAPKGLRRACPLKWSSGARRLCEGLEEVTEPLPGDIMLQERGSDGGSAHVGLVLYHTLPKENLFGTIEGNKGRYPSKVRTFNHEFGEGGLLGFYRVPWNGLSKEWLK